MSIETLKEQARSHEQKEEWQKALDQYRKAIDKLAAEEQPDIGLYNRVGDLYVRVGQLDAAVEHYEQSVDLYMEAFLPNNAIAVCKKIIRNVPDRHATDLTMGQIRAEQGFLPDARANFLTYAERMQQAGDLDESFRALVEFCDLAPDDVDIRIMVADQMASNDRADEALEQLTGAHRHLMARGHADQAGAVEAKIRELDPEADLGGLVATPSAELDSGGQSDSDDLTDHFSEIASGDSDEPEEEDVDLSGFDIEVGSSDGDDTDAEGEDGGELPGFDMGDDAEEGDSLPTFDMGDDAEEGDPVPADASEAVQEAEEDAVTERAADESLTIDDVRQQVAASPSDVSLRQRMVELAYGTGEDTVLAEAFLGLAQTLDESGEKARAQAAYQQVLEADPANEIAAAALRAGPASQPVREVAASEDYVDLGAMIFGDDDDGGEKSTRFTVAYEEPSGDEEADFAQMLSQFKSKVSESIDADDVRAHHDLGTAYKEMGLFDEAISEFQLALRASGDHLPTYELLGITFMEIGKPEATVNALERALDVDFEIEDELLGIYYYLARAHEMLGNTNRALELYDKVFSLDINFADVTVRLRALR
ncbi:MAG: tetratricopeptide repeat protein [Gemmatimonadota bacterium]|nr:tetratricopeptide repeat protein [Gemmatimonadota bacterium]